MVHKNMMMLTVNIYKHILFYCGESVSVFIIKRTGYITIKSTPWNVSKNYAIKCLFNKGTR